MTVDWTLVALRVIRAAGIEWGPIGKSVVPAWSSCGTNVFLFVFYVIFSLFLSFVCLFVCLWAEWAGWWGPVGKSVVPAWPTCGQNVLLAVKVPNPACLFCASPQSQNNFILKLITDAIITVLFGIKYAKTLREGVFLWPKCAAGCKGAPLSVCSVHHHSHKKSQNQIKLTKFR